MFTYPVLREDVIGSILLWNVGVDRPEHVDILSKSDGVVAPPRRTGIRLLNGFALNKTVEAGKDIHESVADKSFPL